MTSLRMMACGLLVLSACTKSAESREVEPSTEQTVGTAESGAANTAAEPPDRAIADTVERPVLAQGDDQTPEGAKTAPTAAANLKDTARPHAGHAAVASPKSQIVALSSQTLAETGEYKLVLDVPDGATTGKEDSVKVTLTPKNGWKLNKEFPTKLKVTPPDGVKVSNPKQGAEDAVEFSEKGRAVWHVKFTSDSSGKKDFGGEFRFAVCTESTCDPKKEKLAFAVNVK